MNRRLAILLMLVAVSASSAWADVVLTVGDAQVATGGTVQVPVYVSGDATLTGMELDFQIASGEGTQPAIQSVDLLTGTIWSGELANTEDVLYSAPQLSIISITPVANHVAGDGHGGSVLLATVTINATGVAANSNYNMSVIDTENGSSIFVAPPAIQLDATGTDGTLHVTPEPISMSLLGFGAVGLLLRRRRR